jgi:DNA transposition AAA+ family ATPase
VPTHFLGLTGAATLDTRQFQLAGRVMDDLVEADAVGVIHGPAGVGKTFTVTSHLERMREAGGPRVVTVPLAFPSKPTMLRVATDLTCALTGSAPTKSRNRFQLINGLIGLLSGPKRLVVIDEAQRLNSECIELLRHLHDHQETSFALLYVGGDGCWEVLSREPMLRSRVYRRLPFLPVPHDQVPELIRDYHQIYHQASDALLWEIDDSYAHGTLRDWAAFTRTAAGLCAELGREHLDAGIVVNAYTLMGGGLA